MNALQKDIENKKGSVVGHLNLYKQSHKHIGDLQRRRRLFSDRRMVLSQREFNLHDLEISVYSVSETGDSESDTTSVDSSVDISRSTTTTDHDATYEEEESEYQTNTYTPDAATSRGCSTPVNSRTLNISELSEALSRLSTTSAGVPSQSSDRSMLSESSRTSASSSSTVVCFRCRETGHIAKRCKKDPKSLPEKLRNCNAEHDLRKSSKNCNCGGACNCPTPYPSDVVNTTKTRWAPKLETLGQNIDWNEPHVQYSLRSGSPWAVQQIYISENERQSLSSNMITGPNRRNYELVVKGYDFSHTYSMNW